SDEATAFRGEVQQPDLAQDLPASPVAVQPLEPRGLALERLLVPLPYEAGGRTPVGLERRAHVCGPELVENLTRHPEQALRLGVHVDEVTGVEIQHHDGLGRVLDEPPVALL